MDVPLDIQVELGVGLLLAILASVSMMTQNLNNVSLVHSQQNKSLAQVDPRKSFRSVTSTRGRLFRNSGALSIPSVEEAKQRNSALAKLA